MEKAANGQFVPRMFEVFGPKIINGRHQFQDDATESRCLAYTPPQTARTDIPRQLPPSFEAEARRIRNQLLGWRFDVLDTFEPREILIRDLRPRTNQIVMPLLVIADLMSEPHRTQYREDLREFASEMEDQARTDSRGTVEAMLVEAFVNHRDIKQPTCKDLADRVVAVEGESDPKLKFWLTPKKASSILQDMGFKTHHTNRGAVATLDPDRLNALLKRYGIDRKP